MMRYAGNLYGKYVDENDLDVYGEDLLELPVPRETIEKQLWRVEYMTYKEHMDEEYNRGKEEGIKAFIEDKLEDGVTKEVIIEKLMKRFDLTKEKATEYLHKYSE
ncbi:MAG: hypothetical protein IJ695_07940 [Butyrivibrio sp.]|nr:hypothetical protein [Butyrivibrio sp.]